MSPPPLLGYNNNVRHRGQIFHIQTEDSGINSPRIMTHLFADGGRIVKSTRTDYSEYLGRPDTSDIVRNLMKEQHKAMFVALRSGELDEHVGFPADAPQLSIKGGPRAVPVPKAISEPAPAPGRVTPVDSTVADSAVVATAESAAAAESAKGEPAEHQQTESEGAPKEQVAPPPGSVGPPKLKDSDSDRAYASPRPAAIFSGAPQPTGLFGDLGNIDEKSLDDAILSYLAEEPDESSGSR